MYVPKTSCMKGTSAHIYCRICDKTASCHCKVPDFAMFFQAQNISGAFETQASDHSFHKHTSPFNFFRRSADMLSTSKLCLQYVLCQRYLEVFSEDT